MARLVAIDLPGGPGFVSALAATWSDGDAAFPVDRRLPMAARQAVLEAVRPQVLVDRSGRHDLPGGVPVLDGDALVVATSGTTGRPKGVVLTHEAVRASALATSRHLAVDPAADRWLACLPLAHIGGLSVVTRSLVTNTPVTVVDGFDAAIVNAAPGLDRSTRVALVPSALSRVDPSVWRTILLGGSAMPASLPANVVRTYGMTETGSGVVYDGYPLDGVELAIDASGLIRVRAPMLLRAYRDHHGVVTPEGTDPKDRAGWFATGDAGAIDADGMLSVSGRVGDVIVTGAEKVWPEAVERVLATAPGVEDVAVIGLPDADWGNRVVALVVATDRSAPPVLDALREHVKGTLPAYCAPRQIVLVDAIPRTSLGKVARARLVRLLTPHLGDD